MRPRFTFSEAVRAVRAIRNDGTYADLLSGVLLVRRDSIGYVRDWGVFLQDQVIYQIHSPGCDQVVSCREQELTAGDRPWLAGNLQYGDSVIYQTALTMQGKMVASVGQLGRIEATGRGEHGDGYIVGLGGRWLQVPVSALVLTKEEEQWSHDSDLAGSG